MKTDTRERSTRWIVQDLPLRAACPVCGKFQTVTLLEELNGSDGPFWRFVVEHCEVRINIEIYKPVKEERR